MSNTFDEAAREEKQQQSSSSSGGGGGGGGNHQKQEDSKPATRPSPPKAPPYPRQPRRPNLRRQVIVAAGGEPAVLGELHGHGSLELTGVPPSVPPKRPTRLPARYATGLGIHGQLGAEQKPNRYSWAQMQHWQQQASKQQQQQQQQQGSAAGPHQGFHHHFSSPFSSAASRVLVVNPMQIVNLSEHTKSSLIKFIEAIKRFSEKWFSHVLLLLFLAVYACFGAYIFISFEAPTEMWEKQLIIDTRSSMINESWGEALGGKTRDEFLDLFRQKLEDYERLLNRACASGMTSSSLENQWTFWNALFYSMTVFTTIGYGHLTPITFAGRVATMVYAIFGIPILLMVLADLGKLLTRIIKYAFKRFRYLYNKLLRRKSSLRTRKLISDNTHQYIGVARDAFERGFAYVQHQPAAIRVSSLKQKLFHHPNQQQQLQQQQQSPGVSATQGAEESRLSLTSSNTKIAGDFSTTTKMDETTDVIVTPANQTKPVSPPIGQEKKSLADTVIQAHHSATASHGHPHHRAQSPAFRIRRKVSTSGLMGSRRHHNQQPAKNSLSKSSSSKEVHPPATEHKTNKKHHDSAPTEPTTPPIAVAAAAAAAASSIEDKPKSDPVSTSDADVTTDETIDVAVDEFDMDDEDEGGEQEQLDEGEEIEDEFDIPVSFALFLLVTYMMFGAVVFSIWEGWNFFDSLYFVFISMSTIGFGDLVPQHPKRMIGTFIYLLFGLALTSMCINVVQEKIHATFLRAKMQIGEKMGFDLDQIMADDYYDGSLVYDVEGGGGGGGGGGGEPGDDTNSLAVSQTNSTSGDHLHLQHQHHNHHHHHHHHAAGETSLMMDPSKPISQSLDSPGEQHAAPLKQSKSKESLKMKKRSVASLPGSNPATGSSFKRKPSKKMLRQGTHTSCSSTTMPPALANLQTSNFDRQQQLPSTATNVIAPVRSQIIEVHRMEPMLVADHHHQQQQQQHPGINAPVNSVKSICEPLRMRIRDNLWANGNRPKLAATRSLQPGSYPTEPTRSKSNNSSAGPGSPGPFAYRSGSEVPADTGFRRTPVKSSSYQCRSELEAALSRRSSVSQELNQLDDLIVALGRSPSDKFGPLLGIPSSNRSSRSNSPSNQAQQQGLSTQRRGTSMTSRSPSRRPAQALAKYGSVSSSSSVNNMSPTCQPLNLSESQAALDELEAVKLRL